MKMLLSQRPSAANASFGTLGHLFVVLFHHR